MTRRAIIACALWIFASAASCSAQAPLEITFGMTSNTAFGLAHYIATEKKYYEADNLKVDSIVAGAAVRVVQQLATGYLHIAHAATDQPLRAVPRGPPIRIIAGASSNTP